MAERVEIDQTQTQARHQGIGANWKNSKCRRQTQTEPEDAIIDGLFTVSTVRYDNEIWPRAGCERRLENVCSQ